MLCTLSVTSSNFFKMRFKILIALVVLIFTSASRKPYSMQNGTIMAIFAHPDDETTISPLLAKYAAEGHDVYLVIATKGELGVTKHAGIPAGDSSARIRASEAKCVSENLGIKPPILLGLGDGSLAKDFTGRPLRQKLDSILQQYKPEVVITWGPDGGYGHMDHRTVHNVVTEIFQSRAYPYPKQLYYTGIPSENTGQALNIKTNEVKWMSANWKSVKKEYLPVRIKCPKQSFDKAELALKCHRSQFSNEQMEDVRHWMTATSWDTVYLRSFIPQKTITFNLFR